MPPRVSWRHLIPGLVALSALIAIGLAVLMYAGVGEVRGEKVRIHVLTDQARGVMPGAEVWLDGQKAGVVEHVGFRAPSSDTLHRVVISADLLVDAAGGLRSDSRIQVRPGGNVIGPVVLFLESGSPSGTAVRSGDTLRALAQSDAEGIMETLGGATIHLPEIVADAKTVAGYTRSLDGTVGAMLSRGLPTNELRTMRRSIKALRARVGEMRQPSDPVALLNRARSAIARVDSIRVLIRSPNTSLGRFRRDSTLPHAVGEIRGELDSLHRAIAESEGTFARLRSDSALVRSVADARVEMTLLAADVRRRPLRYIHF